MNRLEFEQKCQYNNLTENFNKSKKEIFNEIKNLEKYQPAPNTQGNKIKEKTKIETNIIKNTTIINEKNDSKHNALNKINSKYFDNENINKNIKNNNDIILGTNKDINEDEKKYDNNIDKKDENVNKIPDNK